MNYKKIAMRRALQTLALLGLLGAGGAWGQAGDTLSKVRDSGVINLGVRANAAPMSFAANGSYSGYMVEVCRAVVGAILPSARINYVPMLGQARTNLLDIGQIDIECADTEDVPSRRRDMSFSTPVLFSTARLITSNKLRISRLSELGGASVAFLQGTVTERMLREKLTGNANFQPVYSTNGWADVLNMVLSGRADAGVMFNLTLVRLVAEANANNQVNWVDEPVGPMVPVAITLRKDDVRFQSAIDGALANLAANKQLQQMYGRWFQGRLENGMVMSMSPNEATRQLLGAANSQAGGSNSQQLPSTQRDDPKVFGRSARGG